MPYQFDGELKDTVRYLGRTLGETIKNELGEAWLDRIETIRKTGRHSFQGDQESSNALQALFADLNDDELLTVGRAFAQFLNLGNIAEQEYNSNLNAESALDSLFAHLSSEKGASIDKSNVEAALEKLDIDLVLTAHPTEVTRRTLIHKHSQLAACLQDLHTETLDDVGRERLQNRIADLISQAWHTEEIRSVRPTPVDEARWGFSVIENSLWEAVPDFLRDFDTQLQHHLDVSLPIDAAPVHFSSWMGGDRDGNPFVTAKVTQTVLLSARRRAAKLFARDLDQLQVELSMRDCSDALREVVGETNEPYRALLRPLLRRMELTRDGITDHLNGKTVSQAEWVSSNNELLEPLNLCYQSLLDCGMPITAKGLLLDTIRRVHCFGIHLLRLDVRQDSQRHTDVFSELTRYLGLGDYAQWNRLFC